MKNRYQTLQNKQTNYLEKTGERAEVIATEASAYHGHDQMSQMNLVQNDTLYVQQVDQIMDNPYDLTFSNAMESSEIEI